MLWTPVKNAMMVTQFQGMDVQPLASARLILAATNSKSTTPTLTLSVFTLPTLPSLESGHANMKAEIPSNWNSSWHKKSNSGKLSILQAFWGSASTPKRLWQFHKIQ